MESASFGQGTDHLTWAKEAMESAGAANTVEYVGDLVDHDPLPWIAGYQPPLYFPPFSRLACCAQLERASLGKAGGPACLGVSIL